MAHKLLGQLTLNQIDEYMSGKTVTNTKTYVKNVSGGLTIDPVTNKLVPPMVLESDITPVYKQRSYAEQINYATQYKDEEKRKLMNPHEEVDNFDDSASVVSGVSASTFMEGVETESYVGSVMTAEDQVTRDVKVYDQYDFTVDYNTDLPIAKYKDEIVNKIESNSVTIIQGSTGSGKTTQVPQYILDQYARERRWCNIVVTQPRRIAAQSIAGRVCSERGWAPGSLCGYQISMEKQSSPDTRILYMTTGVLLQILANEGHLRRYSHVILDEVHERDQYTDFCLLVCRKYLRQNSRTTKLVLMSATFDCERFAEYYSVPIHGRLEPAPIITVKGRIHRVDEYYVEDITVLGSKPHLEAGNPCLSEEVKELIKKLVEQFDKLEIQEQGTSSAVEGLAETRGTVLVFLPGFAEISAIKDALMPISTTKLLKLLPVHSSLTMEEQIEVFRPPDGRHRKVILSTNISESSITVPDIQYVIDSCLTKNLVCDEDTNYPLLQLDWAAKANCIQRKGRAGRVARGRVYRMVTREFYEDVLIDYAIPEMRRCPLDQLVLKCKMLTEKLDEYDPPKALLALAIDPPLLDDIERTVLTLKEVSALSNTVEGRPNPHDGDLTFMGRVMARMPCDVRLAKLIIYGYVLGVLEDAIIIAAALSNRSIFANPFNDKYKAFCQRMRFSGMYMSDCFAVINAFKLWNSKKQEGAFRRQNVSEYTWCKQNFLEKRRLEDVTEMIGDLKARLENDCAMNVPRDHHRHHRNDDEDRMLLRIAFCAAFYPNFFIRNPINVDDASKEMCGMDPCTTVMVRGLPPENSLLYRSQLERIFREKLLRYSQKGGPQHVPEIIFESAKAYIEFKLDTFSSCKVSPIVMEVLNLRHHFPVRLDPIDVRAANEKMKEVRQEIDRQRQQASQLRTSRIKSVRGTGHGTPSTVRQVELPRPDQHYLYLAVRVVKDCGHFWATYGNDMTEEILEEIGCAVRGHIQHPNRKPKLLTPSCKPGTYCLALYYNEYYRARLEAVEPLPGTSDLAAWVFFLDYGNEERCPLKETYEMPSQLLEWPFQAIECNLAEIRPPQLGRFDGGYSQHARDYFIHQVLNHVVMAQIYSVVNNKIRCLVVVKQRLYNGDEHEVNINEDLIRKGMAEQAEEAFLSKQNSQFREQLRHTGGVSSQIDAPTVTVSVSDDGLYDVTNRSRNIPKIKVFGPMSPYEVTWTGLTRATKLRCVTVERDSVNNITVDDDPYNEADRLLVSSNVNMTSGRNSVSLRHTTVMPFIPGLPALVSLLFTPYAELRTDAERTRYAGALCGLGPDCNGRSIYPDHDMEVSFDVLIDDDDLTRINQIRNNISIVLSDRADGQAPLRQYTHGSLQNRLRKKIIEFILKRREPVARRIFTKQHRWNQVPDSLICHPYVDDPEEEEHHLLQLHSGILLSTDNNDQTSTEDSLINVITAPVAPHILKKRLIEHNNQLRLKARHSTALEDITCELCDEKLRHPRALLIHLHTRFHLQKEAELLE